MAYQGTSRGNKEVFLFPLAQGYPTEMVQLVKCISYSDSVFVRGWPNSILVDGVI